jgi:hypothetical protein
MTEEVRATMKSPEEKEPVYDDWEDWEEWEDCEDW